MPRGLDHIVHAVRDLDAAAALYRRLGFTVGARNTHPWGTHNHIVQFSGSFIELLTVAEPEKLGSDGFSKLFGAYNRDFLTKHEGFSLLIAELKDAAADEKTFRQAGVAQSEVMRFDREAKRPDGSTVKVGFSLAFAQDKGAPEIHFATCQQHYPENFWNPSFQQHRNGTRGIAGVAIVADRPAEHRDFIAAFTGVTDITATTNGVTAKTPRGTISVMSPVGFRSTFGTAAPDAPGGARLAAARFAVTDIAALEELLRAENVAFAAQGGRIVIGAGTAMGATIVFEQAAN